MSLDGDHDADARRPDDESDEPSGPPGPRAAYAVNWKTVVAVDASMGLAVVVAGLIALIVWNFWVGALLMAAGCTYLAMVAFRADQWRRLRRDAGL